MKAVVHPDDGLFILSECADQWLPRAVFAALAPLLDGQHDVEDIFAQLIEKHPAEDILAALDDLRARGFLAPEAVERGPCAGFWDAAGVTAGAAQERLAHAGVAVHTVGDIDVGPLAELLDRHGLRAAPLDTADLAVVLTDDYLRPELAAFNGTALERGRAWLLARPVGTQTWIGPAFVPGATACWHCLAQRLAGHRRIEAHLARTMDDGAVARPLPAWLPASLSAALAEIATAVVRWIGTGGATSLENAVVSTDVLTLERRRHTLVRRPQCPACGHAAAVDARRATPPQLRTRPKLALAEGGYRACDARVFAERVEAHVSPITGIISGVVPGERSGRRHAGGPWLTPTFAADHNFRDMHDERYFLREGMRRRSGGKGRTPEQARISALAESIERYCGVFDGTEPRLRATFAALADAAVRPNDCALYSDRQYAARSEQNGGAHKARWVPEPFRDDVEIEWTPLWSLTDGRTRYLPTSYCYFGYRSADAVFARADSNGCAAGCVLEEAVLQGLLELVERDAVAIWWYNRLRRPGVDLGAFDDPYATALERHYRSLGRRLWVLDVTSDTGIPTFAALSRRVDGAGEDIIYGFGAHLDARVALSRALTELNQSLEAVPDRRGSLAAQAYRGDAEAVHWWRSVRTAEAPYVTPDDALPARGPADFACLASDDVLDDVDRCIVILRTRGIEVLVLDQTRPDVGIPVVRVVAPGLRHFWARFAPGRLYDVPVRAGWRTRPLDEDELNHFAIHF